MLNRNIFNLRVKKSWWTKSLKHLEPYHHQKVLNHQKILNQILKRLARTIFVPSKLLLQQQLLQKLLLLLLLLQLLLLLRQQLLRLQLLLLLLLLHLLWASSVSLVLSITHSAVYCLFRWPPRLFLFPALRLSQLISCPRC